MSHGLSARSEKVEDLEDIMKCGVMMTPALVADGLTVRECRGQRAGPKVKYHGPARRRGRPRPSPGETAMAQRRGPPRRAVGRPAKEATGETETQILDAAEQVFAKVGFYGATTQAIAEECCVTKAMIHYYFDSKEKLYRAVLDRILFELIKLVQEASAQRVSRAERLDHFVRGFFDYVSRHPNFGRLTYMGSGDQSRYFDGIVTTFFRPLFDRGVRFIEAGIAEGEFRAVDSRQVLLAIYSTAMGYFADAPFISLILEDEALKPTHVNARREALLDMVFRALGVPAPSARRKN